MNKYIDHRTAAYPEEYADFPCGEELASTAEFLLLALRHDKSLLGSNTVNHQMNPLLKEITWIQRSPRRSPAA